MEHPFEQFPRAYVHAAFRKALEAARYDPSLCIVTHAFYLCQRWTHCPYLHDAPPVDGRLPLPPPEMQVPVGGKVTCAGQMTKISDVLARMDLRPKGDR